MNEPKNIIFTHATLASQPHLAFFAPLREVIFKVSLAEHAKAAKPF
jgi:hypothetical protein